MNTKKTTINLPYDSKIFSAIISRMTRQDVFDISIEVWTYDDNGKQIELLRSNLSSPIFDKLASNATRMIFTGSSMTLQNLVA